jgi:flagellar protein FlgJ
MIELSPSLPLGPPAAQRDKLGAVATQFEAMLVRQVLAAARQAGFKDELLGSSAGDTFRQMMDDRFADVLAQSGTLGFAKTIETQLTERLGPQETEG